jgi:hypothetical protein
VIGPVPAYEGHGLTEAIFYRVTKRIAIYATIISLATVEDTLKREGRELLVLYVLYPML